MNLSKKFKSKLRFIIKKKYKNTILELKFLNELINFKKKFIFKYQQNKNNNFKLSNVYIKKTNNLEKRLFDIYKSNNKKKFKLEIFQYYKKFNANLSLKKKYNKKFKKLTNSITNPISYAFFGLILINHNKINKFQLLNTLLKINDLLLVNLNLFNEGQKVLIAKCFKEELKQLKKISI